jgi:phage terminase small subunit
MYKILDEIKSNYNDLDERVYKFLERVIKDIDDADITNYNKIIIDMLIPQLVIYYKAIDIIKSETSISKKDDYNRTSKSPEIGVMQKANDQILNLLDKLVLSPLEKAKLKRINKDDEDSAKEILENLMN